MESLPLFKNIKERKLFIIIVFFIFLFNLSLDFRHYKDFTKNEIYQVNGTISNIYHKKNYNILKINTNNFTFFTKYSSNQTKLLENISLYIVTKNITFFSYLKGFYTNSFNITVHKINSNKQRVYNYIYQQHNNSDLSSLYTALFLATSVNQNIREFSNEMGIAHLIALSGFHLGVISVVLYFILSLIYNKIHSKYVPYRNKKFDIMITITFLLFSYLIFTNTPASLLRAFCMFIFALFLLRNNIKVISFETLFIISLVIIALFPKLIFSLSLWFSIAGVFYIFLFIMYFQNLNKVIQFIGFNIWIYLAINPITHFFFPTTALEQLYSPILSILFSIFYPVSVFLHIFNIGEIFDTFIVSLLNIEISSYEVFTKDWFLGFYILVSVLATLKKEMFLLLNLLLIVYNIWLFQFIF